MKTRHKAAASILIISAFSCTDLHKDPIGLLTPEQVSTDPTLNSVKVSVTSSYQMLASTLNLLNEWRWDLGTVFRNDVILQDMASDDVSKKWNPDGDQAWMDQVVSFNFTSSNQAFNGSMELRLRRDIPVQFGHELFDRSGDNGKNCHRSGVEKQAVGRGLFFEGFLLFRSGK